MDIAAQLTLLAELARVEARLREARMKLEAVPASANEKKQVAEEKKKAFDHVDQQRIDLEKQKTELERSLAEAKDHLKKWNLRLEKIRDEREHGALLSEIGGQKKAISRLEYDILEIMEQLEELEKELSGRKKAWDDAQAVADEEFSQIEGELAALNEKADTEDKARKALVEKLPANLVKRYERIAASRKGQGVAVIKGEVCTACNNTLPPQLCLQVYKGAVIESCQICSRILVHEAMTRSEATDEAQAEAASA